MLIDAHLHMDIKQNKPLEALLREMDRGAVDRGVLILNTREEKTAFINDFSTFNENRLRVAFGINPHDEHSINYYSEVREIIRFNRIAKIHPRFMQITRGDFKEIKRLLDRFDMSTIIIDTLVYGPRYEYNTGIELGIYLAEQNPQRNVILAHAGSTRMLECIMMTRWLENIYYDLSFVNPYFLTTSVEIDMKYLLRRTANRVLYGSDYPSFAIDKVKASFVDMCYEVGLNTEEVDKVLFKNASRIYSF